MWSSAWEIIPSDPVAGRVRAMVVGQGSYKQKTLFVTRNMVVYKRDGRWSGCSFDRGSTVEPMRNRQRFACDVSFRDSY